MKETSVGAGPAPRARAVVVGDSSPGLHRLTTLLEPAGPRIVTVASATEARAELAVDDEATVVVLDMRTPGLDALELLRSMRADEHTATTPILLVGGSVAGGPGSADLHTMAPVDVATAPDDAAELRAKLALLADLAVKTRALRLQSERLRRAEERLGRQERVLTAQHAVIRTLADGDPDDLMPRVAQALAHALGWQVGSYWVASGNGVRCAGSWFEPAFTAPALERMQAPGALVEPRAAVRRATDSGGPAWAPLAELDGEDPYVRAALDAGLVGTLALPVRLNGGLLGVIELMRTSLRPPDDETVATLDAGAALAARVAQADRPGDQAEGLKNEFLALVSHELLTPLTSILGYLDELLVGASGDFTPDQQKDLEVIERNARRLFRLVDDLMFVAQVATGKVSLNPMSVDLAAVVLEAVDVARPLAEGRGIDIVPTVEPTDAVRGDVRRLGQVVDHLVSNAVKYSHDGGRVEVVLRPRDGSAVLDVIDQGLGVPVDEQAQVFDRFSRSSITSAMELPGIGLGLSITKVIVEAHGGTIAMRSVEGEGSTFTVTLPIEPRSGHERTDHDEE